MAAPYGADNASPELEGRGRIVNTEARAELVRDGGGSSS